jgi:hypothetical protein
MGMLENRSNVIRYIKLNIYHPTTNFKFSVSKLDGAQPIIKSARRNPNAALFLSEIMLMRDGRIVI